MQISGRDVQESKEVEGDDIAYLMIQLVVIIIILYVMIQVSIVVNYIWLATCNCPECTWRHIIITYMYTSTWYTVNLSQCVHHL